MSKQLKPTLTRPALLLACLLLAACGADDLADPRDTDLDGLADHDDNCPLIANSDQADLDADALGDVCDKDRDGDGILNEQDDFPSDSSEYLDLDGDGVGHHQDDDNDGDGFNDDVDNCPYVVNPDQADSNGINDAEGLGDACELSGLNDSGQARSGGFNEFNHDTCRNGEEDLTRLQDCNFGRDALAEQGLLVGDLAKTGGGKSGFDFVKLGSDGLPLEDQSGISYCVKDQVTGLIWERKHSGNQTNLINHFEDRYYWYNSDSEWNAGVAGTRTAPSNLGARPCQGYVKEDETSWCNTENYIKRMNEYEGTGYCGINQWRLPSVSELNSLVDYEEASSSRAIDTGYFSNFSNVDDITFWTRTNNARLPREAWAVIFKNGANVIHPKDSAYFVRLVHAPEEINDQQQEISAGDSNE